MPWDITLGECFHWVLRFPQLISGTSERNCTPTPTTDFLVSFFHIFLAITGLDLFLGLPKEEHYRTARLQDYYSTNIMRQIKYLYSIYSDPVQLKVIKQFAFETDSLGQRSILPESDFSKLGVSNCVFSFPMPS